MRYLAIRAQLKTTWTGGEHGRQDFRCEKVIITYYHWGGCLLVEYDGKCNDDGNTCVGLTGRYYLTGRVT